MATVLLAALGGSIGAAIGGTAMGLSAAAIGRFAGATIGQRIDQHRASLGADPVETGRIDRLRLTGTGEGHPIAFAAGRVRTSGHIIWASQFTQDVDITGATAGGKGMPPQPAIHSYRYSVHLAVGLCQGEIAGVSRLWADGVEIGLNDVTMRVYRGTADQQPDPTLEAIEGIGQVPAYRDLAYVVFEDLQLAQFGNRIPQFSFEVIAPVSRSQYSASLAETVPATAMIPATGEYALATTQVVLEHADGSQKWANRNTPSGYSDFQTSLFAMGQELPNCQSVSLVVSWFGDDLRCSECTIKPKIEQSDITAPELPWAVSGLDRTAADMVPRVDNAPVYGGTPSDVSVKQSIQALTEAGQKVMFYPFVLMDQLSDNTLPNPYGDGAQPALPWRGRITLDRAPGFDNSMDGSSIATMAVDRFFGTAQAEDFEITSDGTITFSGDEDFGYRRFILHYAHLCVAAGGVDSFCIGSEMRGLTQIMGPEQSFPAVDQFIALARDVRAILGPNTKISYAADWSEYFGYSTPQGDHIFHLDPLWACDDIDFIGIDNYMPLADWRDDLDHRDRAWGSIYNPDYLSSNIEGGEGYDWYYANQKDRDFQIRTPITDGEHSEPWVWRYKDLRNWWSNRHHNRIGGKRADTPTLWKPRSKPIWFTELGCAAINKGANEPNKFLDPKSSESQLPHYSNGLRDDAMQNAFLNAVYDYWSDSEKNPWSDDYNGPMIDVSRIYVWAWDARPYPWFPNARSLWADGPNYRTGHWLNGRSTHVPLAGLVADICAMCGIVHFDVSRLYGVVRGFHISRPETGRQMLQALSDRYSFDIVERQGMLVFVPREQSNVYEIDNTRLVQPSNGAAALETRRSAPIEMPSRVQLVFEQADADFAPISEEINVPFGDDQTIARFELPLVMTRSEARETLEHWLAEMRAGVENLQFSLPRSLQHLNAGDWIKFSDDPNQTYRIDQVERGPYQTITAKRVDPFAYQAGPNIEDPNDMRPHVPPLPVDPLFLDIPKIRSQDDDASPYVVLTGSPWPGSASVFSSEFGMDPKQELIVTQPGISGVTTQDVAKRSSAVQDNGAGIVVTIGAGRLGSVSQEAMENGHNFAALGNPDTQDWEVIQFQNAELVGMRTYRLTGVLRGQLGTENAMPDVWPVGTRFVFLGTGAAQLSMALEQRGVVRDYYVGPTGRSLNDPAYRKLSQQFDAKGRLPLAPCHLRCRSNGDELELTWIRRGRTEANTWNENDIPFDEVEESYRVDILYNQNILTTVYAKTPKAVFNPDELTQIGFDPTDPNWHFRVAQMSMRVGPGSAAQCKIT